LGQAQADLNRFIHEPQGAFIQSAQPLDETNFIDRPNLAQQCDGSDRETRVPICRNQDVDGVQRKPYGGGDRRDDREIGKAIRYVVLDDQRRARFLDLSAYRRV
jgi:hypothetical protein